jgi:hypothetical protein
MGEVFDIDDMAASMQSGSGRGHVATFRRKSAKQFHAPARGQARPAHRGTNGIT